MNKLNFKEILNLHMGENDARAATIGDYFILLLLNLWEEGESFSGKRPFGNSGWEYELYKPLLKAGVIEGSIDECGDVEGVDIKAAWHIVNSTLQCWCTHNRGQSYGAVNKKHI